MMEYPILITAGIGFLISLYTSYIDLKLMKQKDYKAACDISDTISCTKAFKSGYGSVFGIPNGAIGIIFYAIVLLLAFFGFANFVFYLSVLSLMASAYLAYVLHFKVRAICLVCYSIYIINIVLFILSYGAFRIM